MFFRLYANCILINGAKESIICDLENQCYFPIPNLLYDILKFNQENQYKVDELKKSFQNQYNDGIDAYFNFFSEKGIGFYTTEPELFPELKCQWHSPFLVTNAILEISHKSTHCIEDVLGQLNELGCQAIEFRILDSHSLNKMNKVLCLFEESRFQCYVLTIKYHSEKDVEKGELMLSSFNRISNLHFFYVPKKKCDYYGKFHKDKRNIFFTPESFLSNDKKCNGKEKIIININTFMESQKHNLALNRKIAITLDGSIKNYLTQKKAFDNVNFTKINDIFKNKDFTEVWFISNDNIEVCKDCQFRYICFDTSDINLQNGQLVKVDKCSFDPYKNEWI